ncbi:MAG: PIN domain-containing protein [Pyrinomonadaceae bacterium]
MRRSGKNLEEYLTRYLVLHSDDQMCDRWAQAMHSARLRGRAIAPADEWIAATALLLDIPLVTHNGAHYAGIPDFRGLAVWMLRR